MAKKTKMVSPYEYKTGRVYADSKVWFCIAATRVSIKLFSEYINLDNNG